MRKALNSHPAVQSDDRGPAAPVGGPSGPISSESSRLPLLTAGWLSTRSHSSPLRAAVASAAAPRPPCRFCPSLRCGVPACACAAGPAACRARDAPACAADAGRRGGHCRRRSSGSARPADRLARRMATVSMTISALSMRWIWRSRPPFLRRHQRQRLAARAGATGAADAVHVVLRHHRQVVVDHQRQLRDVEPARGDVGGDQHPHLARLLNASSAFCRCAWLLLPWIAAACRPAFSSCSARRLQPCLVLPNTSTWSAWRWLRISISSSRACARHRPDARDARWFRRWCCWPRPAPGADRA